MPLVINGEQIDDTVVEHEFSEIKAHHERIGKVSCCDRDEEFRTQARDNLIARVLIGQKAAESTPMPSDTEVETALKDLVNEHGGEQHFYSNMGMVPDQLEMIKTNIASSLQVDNYLKEACPPENNPSEADLQNFYQENEDNYRTNPEVRASHIFKSVRMAEDREDTFKTLCDVREKLMKGGCFDELAKLHTDKPHDEIDLGWFKRGELMDEFEVMAFSMDVDEISPVFTTHGSFHIAKLTEKRPARLVPFVEIEKEVMANYQQSKRDDAIQELVKALREESEVETFEDVEEPE
ncbi:peptidylprolyl isomerase [Verrucomicrobia bacterium]|nr:peptidylprolyl isomerase [Verrucomicrobiota bacterium]